jgi:hypothetical protein
MGHIYIPPAYSPAAGAVDELGMFIARNRHNAQFCRRNILENHKPIDA